MPIDRITIFCFTASYAVALTLELLHLARPRPLHRLLATVFASAGLLAHTLFLVAQHISLATQAGSLLFLAWILAMFCLYGAIHHRRASWGVFVLPLVLGLTILGGLFDHPNGETAGPQSFLSLDLVELWRLLHIGLFILAAVGVSVAFIASLMYLVQAQRLKAKALPGQGLKLLSLEKLEQMNRRGIEWAFPLLTVGLVVGMVQLGQSGDPLKGWTDPRILSTTILWFVFAIVLYLRYGLHLRGRRAALWTVLAFALLLVTLVTSHSPRPGGGP
jgi:ABC-type transport system involved in cytochrome c biogenesis permease subunit